MLVPLFREESVENGGVSVQIGHFVPREEVAGVDKYVSVWNGKTIVDAVRVRDVDYPHDSTGR